MQKKIKDGKLNHIEIGKNFLRDIGLESTPTIISNVKKYIHSVCAI